MQRYGVNTEGSNEKHTSAGETAGHGRQDRTQTSRPGVGSQSGRLHSWLGASGAGGCSLSATIQMRGGRARQSGSENGCRVCWTYCQVSSSGSPRAPSTPDSAAASPPPASVRLLTSAVSTKQNVSQYQTPSSFFTHFHSSQPPSFFRGCGRAGPPPRCAPHLARSPRSGMGYPSHRH